MAVSKGGQGEMNLNNPRRGKFNKPLKQYYDHLLRRLGIDCVLSDNVHFPVPSLKDLVYSCPSDYKPKTGPFKMIVKSELARITKLIASGSNPLTTLKLWNLSMAHADWESGIVLLTRNELAEEAGVAPPHVSKAMKLLEGYGAILSYKDRGRTMYQCCYDVGWAGKSMSDTQKNALWMKERLERLKSDADTQPALAV